MRSSTFAPTNSTSRRSSSNHRAIRRKSSPTTNSSTPTRITGSCTRLGVFGSARSSASILPRALSSPWSSRDRVSPVRWPNSCSRATALTC
jgi:hypothetical protein